MSMTATAKTPPTISRIHLPAQGDAPLLENHVEHLTASWILFAGELKALKQTERFEDTMNGKAVLRCSRSGHRITGKSSTSNLRSADAVAPVRHPASWSSGRLSDLPRWIPRHDTPVAEARLGGRKRKSGLATALCIRLTCSSRDDAAELVRLVSTASSKGFDGFLRFLGRIQSAEVDLLHAAAPKRAAIGNPIRLDAHLHGVERGALTVVLQLLRTDRLGLDKHHRVGTTAQRTHVRLAAGNLTGFDDAEAAALEQADDGIAGRFGDDVVTAHDNCNRRDAWLCRRGHGRRVDLGQRARILGARHRHVGLRLFGARAEGRSEGIDIRREARAPGQCRRRLWQRLDGMDSAVVATCSQCGLHCGTVRGHVSEAAIRGRGDDWVV